MFGRQNTQDGMPQPVSTPPAQPHQSSPPGGGLAGGSVIGNDLTIVGQKITIVSQGRVQIDGEVEGDINGQEVVIGQGGRVDGVVSADAVEVRGVVNGAIRGSSVSLHPTAKVDGDIFHQTLAISEGAEFDGRVRRPKDGSELRPQLDVNVLKQAAQS